MGISGGCDGDADVLHFQSIVAACWKRTRWVLAFGALALFLATSFRAGWTRNETDFPNYYTAAVLVLKRQPVRNYYDWTWFQRQMNYAGIENQLGGYIPQTPLTMLPLLPIAKLQPQASKRAWLLANLVFLIVICWLLSRVTRFSAPAIALLAFAGFGSLHSNFLLGQYYVFLLLLLVAAFYCLSREKQSACGMFLGLAFVLKLYGGPFVLYFAAKRRRAAVFGWMLAAALAIVAASFLFGWADLRYFADHILPRATQGETLDPYNSGNGTISTLLRRTFMSEPELNPHPLWNTPWIFFFLQPFVSVLILLVPLLLVRRSSTEKRDFAWFCIALLLASPNTASYTFILLLLPITLLLEEATLVERALLIGCYVLLNAPSRPAWSWLFPKVWLLLALFLLVGRHYTSLWRKNPAVLALATATAIALAVAWRAGNAYLLEPGRRWERIAVERGAIYSSSPAVLRSGIVYESIGRAHYVLRWMHDHRDEEFSFSGEALHPVAESPDGPIRFELVAHGASANMRLDVLRKRVTREAAARLDAQQAAEQAPAISPDGRWIALTKTKGGSEQLWLQQTHGGSMFLLAGGNCNSFSPAWEPEGRALIFASDCDRGIGLPALYRASLDRLALSGSTPVLTPPAK